MSNSAFMSAMLSKLIRKFAASSRPVMGPSAIIDGARFEFPCRVYFYDSGPSIVCDDMEALLSQCVFTRHHDGYVRQANLVCILNRPIEYVAIPFILKLAEEYVIEIIQLILNYIEVIPQQYLARFLKENPIWLRRMNARCISYWNCYYRVPRSVACGEYYLHYSDYPGAKVVNYLNYLTADSKSKANVAQAVDELND